MKSHNNILIQTLRNEFLDKIRKEWDLKWRDQHGKVFDYANMKSQNAFLNDLILDIEKTLKSKIGLDETSKILISTDNLRRIFINQNQSNWQEKTKNTLAIYLDYKNWEDFVSMRPVLVTPTKEIKKQRRNLIIALSVTSVLLLASLFWFFKTYKVDKVVFEEYLPNGKPNKKGELNIEIKIPDFKVGNYTINIENEIFQYTQQNEKIAVTTENYIQPLKFYTPGYKKITLRKKGKIIKQINYLIPTQNSWYSCARLKMAEIPLFFENDSEKIWYGFKNKEGNMSNNFITTPDKWFNYLLGLNGHLPNQEWHFPMSLLSTDKSLFSRVVLYKADNFDLSMNTLEISFKAKRDLRISEDCMSFMLEMFDDDYQKFELYSAQNCNVLSNYLFTKWDSPKKTKKIHFVSVNDKLNRVLEDGNWHLFNIKLMDQKIYVDIDGKHIVNDFFKCNFGKLREILFVFENNGHLDDIVLKNSKTHTVIFEEKFDNLNPLEY